MSEEERVRTSLTQTTTLQNTVNREISVENPFREGGQISNDAEEIIDAFKQGKLSVMSNPPPQSELSIPSSLNTSFPPSPNPHTSLPSPHTSPHTDIADSVLRDRKNGTSIKEKPGVFEVQHVVVDVKGDSSLVEKVTIPNKNKKCCCLIL